MKRKKLKSLLLAMFFMFIGFFGCVEEDLKERLVICNPNQVSYFSVSVTVEEAYDVNNVQVELEIKPNLRWDQNTYVADYVLQNPPAFLLESDWRVTNDEEYAMYQPEDICCYVADKDFYYNELQEMKKSALSQMKEKENPFALLTKEKSIQKNGSSYDFFRIKKTVTIPSRLFMKERGELVFYVNPISDEVEKRDRCGIVFVEYERTGREVCLVVTQLPNGVKSKAVFCSPPLEVYAFKTNMHFNKLNFDLEEEFRFEMLMEGGMGFFAYNHFLKDESGNQRTYNVARMTDVAVFVTPQERWDEINRSFGNSYQPKTEFVSKSAFERETRLGNILVVDMPTMRDVVDGIYSLGYNEWIEKVVTIPSAFFTKQEGILVLTYCPIWDMEQMTAYGLDQASRYDFNWEICYLRYKKGEGRLQLQMLS